MAYSTSVHQWVEFVTWSKMADLRTVDRQGNVLLFHLSVCQIDVQFLTVVKLITLITLLRLCGITQQPFFPLFDNQVLQTFSAAFYMRSIYVKGENTQSMSFQPWNNTPFLTQDISFRISYVVKKYFKFFQGHSMYCKKEHCLGSNSFLPFFTI